MILIAIDVLATAILLKTESTIHHLTINRLDRRAYASLLASVGRFIHDPRGRVMALNILH